MPADANQDRIDQVIDAMRGVYDPEIHKDLVTLNMVRDVKVTGDDVSLTVVLTTPACPLRGEIDSRVRAGLAALGWVANADIEMTAEVGSRSSSPSASLPGVKNAIAIASGKGGVGKSTTSVNLAVALRRQGATVGLLDADVYGPNIPLMMGSSASPTATGGKIQAIESYGVKLMSLGFMLDEDTPVIWRGPMIAGALKQLIGDVDWGELDYMIVDLPPGTGDASLSLAQLIPLTGAVIVSTPQAVALQDVRRAISMFERLSVDVLGLIENMSWFENPVDGSRIEIFGHGGARRAAEHLEIPFFGELPLDETVRRGGDEGRPAALFGSDQLIANYKAISSKVAAAISVKNLERVEPLPML